MEMEMKEIHDAAFAYFENLSDELKQKAHDKFNEMDSNGNKTISRDEFQQSVGISSEIKRCFNLLDKSGDGKLNFNEFITLYYLLKSGRGIFCCGNGCKDSPFLNGLYFTCVECFDNNKAETFDLCISCYRDRKYVHDHDNFFDNYVLLRNLRSKAACESTKAIGDEPNPAKPNQVIERGLDMTADLLGHSEFGTPSSPRSGSKLSESDSNFDKVGQPKSKGRALVEGFKSLKDHLGFGDVAAECSIM